MSKKPNTDTLAARAIRRKMPKPSVKFRDHNKYNRKHKHKDTER